LLDAPPPSPPAPLTAPPNGSSRYTVAVRTLCDLTARRGDLDLRFTPSPTAAEGIEGHQRIAARRGPAYETEISLRGHFGELAVRGRADGFDPVLGRLEEIKTHRGDLAVQPEHHRHLHWAQLECYGALFCAERGLERLRLALVYLDIASGAETIIEEERDAAELQAAFEARCQAFSAWARAQAAHREARDTALAPLPFPHAEFRAGQRALAAAVWRATGAGQVLLAQAPTGIGKTVATIYPLLRAMPAQQLEQLYFLTARTTGRQLALDALARLREGGAEPLRVLELTAREKACEHPDKACHGQSCPLAQGFYDRLAAAREAALAAGGMDAPALRTLAASHRICPYWLAQDLMRWADVVVGDYNHFFDLGAGLHTLALESEGRCAVLVDEAHNLPERARQMYSASLDESRWRGLRRIARGPLRRPLQAMLGAWRELLDGYSEADTAGAAVPADQASPGDSGTPGTRGAPRTWGAADSGYRALPQAPDELVRALAHCSSALAEALEGAEGSASPEESALLQEAWFEALGFLRLAERFGSHSCYDLVVEVAGRARRSVLTLRNLLPAPHLQSRWQSVHSAVLFSATLGPDRFIRNLLGVPEEAVWIDIPSPFEADQLQVHLVPQVSTRWADRARSVAPIARLIADQWHRHPGNYLAFFSSYDYLTQVAEQLSRDAPEITQWVQSRRMDEAERRAFVDRFTPGGQGVGFAVLGGAFGEGIDLPGERLVGAFIATLGLPQVNPANERLRTCLQEAFGQGFEDTYLIPGLRKVVQAAGRVIRRPEDRGVVYLIDDRFCRTEVRDLLPRWWQPQIWRPSTNRGAAR